MAYGFSVFWLPLSRAVGGSEPLECRPHATPFAFLFEADCDWLVSDLNWVFTLFIVFLGVSAAIWGGWVEQAGPRKAGLLSAVLWSGGLLAGALGIYLHQLWLLWLGTGVIGGFGLGLGYLSPISTLIKWFPDRRGMAIGMAVMGFGGGPVIGAPMAQWLMERFASNGMPGIWQAFLAMGIVYFVVMTVGALCYRVPAPGWQPAQGTRPAGERGTVAAGDYVHVRDAHRTLAFWAVWVVLCMNVAAGIGVLSMASPMLQEIFGGTLVGHPELSFDNLNDNQLEAIAGVAAGFAGLLALFNIGGRFFWATLSDVLGRKATYYLFFLLGFGLYAAAPWAAHNGDKITFALIFCVILSMYGGGFGAIAAYAADLFGTRYVGAIHGRLLTAWSTAGIIGPVLVSYMRERAIADGIPRASVYDTTLYVLAGLQVVGLLANAFVRPVPWKWFDHDATEEEAERQSRVQVVGTYAAGRVTVWVVLAWAAVVAPMAWGISIIAAQVAVLFR
jgi:MFS family permease